MDKNEEFEASIAAAPIPPSPSRAEFERMIKARTPSAQLTRAENGEYIVPVIQTMWTGYLMAIPEAHFNNAICVFNNDKALVPVINNQQLTQIGFRLTYKSGSTQLIDRAPDSYEIRECKIERLYLVTPAPPAQEAEPVAELTGHTAGGYAYIKILAKTDKLLALDTKFYLHPVNDKLRQAALAMLEVARENSSIPIAIYENLRAALEGKS